MMGELRRDSGGETQIFGDVVTQNVPSPSGGDVTTEAFLARVPEVSLLSLRVVEATDVGTATRLIRLGGDDLAGFTYAVGQDLMFVVDTGNGRIIRRRYTIRRFDPIDRVLDLHIVTDSDGPGAVWTRALAVGDAVEAVGPRGKITLSDSVTSHLFIGDDVSAPAIAAMVEALPPGSQATVFVEIAEALDETKIDPAHGIDLTWTWLHRDGRPAGEVEALLEAVAAAEVPAGVHAYVFGEAQVVNAVGSALKERGVPAERMSPKAYWGRGRANASHGEPLKG
jgi:NADPH-dependent ferric siderophore reductase